MNTRDPNPKGVLSPRDPDAEIHLVLTPFEAAVLLRALEHMTAYYTQSSLLPLSNALRSIGVTPATLNETMKGTLQ